MTVQITPQEFKVLRTYIEEQCGILLGDDKAYLVENRLSHLVLESGCSTFGEFYRKVRFSAQPSPLKEAILDAISTNETLWFRDHHPFRILRESILPRFREKIIEGSKCSISVWSAACSTGQEPYSIALTALDAFAEKGGEPDCARYVRITASDVSGTSLAVAQEGRYSQAVMNRGMTDIYLHRYFRKEANQWEIAPCARDMVTFTRYNLKDTPPRGFGPFDVVFLRNVIIYFSDEFKQRIFEKTARLMSPGAYLFLGTGETVSGYTEAFEMIDDHGGTCYRLRPPKTVRGPFTPSP